MIMLRSYNTEIYGAPLWALPLAALLFYWGSVIVYRLTFHPLAKYPGPLLWRVSIWPTVWACASGRRHMMILRIHKKHGPVVRIGPNMLSFDTSSSVRAIYGPRHANLTKSDFHLTLDATISSPSIFALTDKDRHAFRRRVISYAFTEKAMKSSGEFVLHHTQVLRDVLKKKVGKGWTKVDVGDYMMWWGTDIISSLAMGKSFNCLTSPQYREGLVIMRNAAKFTYWAGHLPFRTLVDFILASPILSRLAGDSAIDNERYFDFCDEAIQQRLKEEEDATDAGIKEDSDLRRKDYIHYLLHAVDPETGKGLTADELKTDASFLLAAGADTSANSVAALMYYLGCHEDSREKACGEVRAVFTSAEEIQDGPKLRSCVYLSACIDEAMRLAPSSTSPPERVVLNEGVEIDGHHIPAGIIVGSFIFGLNLSEHIYREPLRYLPERWLVDETDPDSFTKEEVDKAKHSFFPFSYGHRQCIAKNAAPRNLKVVIATLLWHFDFRQAKELTGAQATGEGEMKGLFGVKDSLITCTLGPVLEMKSRFLTG